MLFVVEIKNEEGEVSGMMTRMQKMEAANAD